MSYSAGFPSFVCTQHIFFICESAYGHLHCRYVPVYTILATVTNAAVNMGGHISLQNPHFNLLDYISRSPFGCLMWCSIFNLLGNLHSLLHSNCTILHLARVYSSTNSSSPPQYLSFFFFYNHHPNRPS